MSTRAHVRIIEGNESICLYHHHDGYPEGVGATLVREILPKLERRKKVPYSIDANDLANHLIKIQDDEYELTPCLHGDEEYVYVIDVDNYSLKCFESGWDMKFEDIVVPEREVDLSFLTK